MPTALLIPEHTPVNDAVRNLLSQRGWTISATDQPVDALVFDPGLTDNLETSAPTDPASALTGLLHTTRFRSQQNGGAAVAVVGSRDQLGRAGHSAHAAAAAALFAATRSLALEYAPAGITVNLVAAPPIGPDAPSALLPDAATAEDIATCLVFFIDPRSRYITGQLLFCDAGSSLLSSMSV